VSAVSAIVRSNLKKLKAIMISTLLRIAMRDPVWFYVKGRGVPRGGVWGVQTPPEIIPKF
jgi:hypothetical protein